MSAGRSAGHHGDPGRAEAPDALEEGCGLVLLSSELLVAWLRCALEMVPAVA